MLSDSFEIWNSLQYKAKYYIWHRFWCSPENSRKWSRKTNFLAFFQRLFDHTLLQPKGHAPIFCQIKGLMMIHNHGKLHQPSICGSKVINFQMFSWRCSSHKMGPSWGFLGPFFPKYGSNLSKFGPEVAHHKRRTGCECFKIMCLSTNRVYPRSSFLVHFWAQFTPGKRNILSKTKIFPETASLGLSDDTSPKSQINRRILIKIIKKPHFLSPKWA